MRCPKCGYISFDHVDTCLKCNKDITKAASSLTGTTYNVSAPSFLRFTKREDSEDEDLSDIELDDEQDDFGVVDPDLDVLVDDDEDEQDDDGATISFGDDFEGFDGLEEEESLELSDEDDDEEGGIDLGQFEDAFETEEPSEEDSELTMDLPDELADLSDLSAPGDDSPALQSEPAEDVALERSSAPSEGGEDVGDFSLDLELDGLDDDFSLSLDDDEEQQEDEDLGDLSLDDLGLSSDEENEEKKTASKKDDDMDMDADLDFDLDLGDLGLDDDD